MTGGDASTSQINRLPFPLTAGFFNMKSKLLVIFTSFRFSFFGALCKIFEMLAFKFLGLYGLEFLDVPSVSGIGSVNYECRAEGRWKMRKAESTNGVKKELLALSSLWPVVLQGSMRHSLLSSRNQGAVCIKFVKFYKLLSLPYYI